MINSPKQGKHKHYPKEEPLLIETKRLLRRFGLRARKSLGQHFLTDEETLKLIITAAELSGEDTVIEVGPGLGVLTRELARQAGRVIAVELDGRLAATLQETLASFPNVTVINGDVLDTSPAVLLGSRRIAKSGYKVVANLPYYIASPVLRHFLEAEDKPGTMVVMVQKEVAEEITARPGQLSLLGIGIQFYGEPQVVGHVAAGCFYPPPEVDSAILKITVYPRPAVSVDEPGFFALVRAGFSTPRKQLGNSLARGLSLTKSEVLPLLERAGIDPKRRAETLTLEEWAQLWRTSQKQSGASAC